MGTIDPSALYFGSNLLDHARPTWKLHQSGQLQVYAALKIAWAAF